MWSRAVEMGRVMWPNMIRIAALAALVAVTSSDGSRAQVYTGEPRYDVIRPPLLVDYAYFRSDDSDLGRLELYYQIFNHGLTFKREGERLRSGFELTAVVKKGNAVIESASRKREILLPADQEARTRTDHRTGQINFELPMNERYEIELTLTDDASGKVVTRDIKVQLQKLYGERPGLSTIEFAQAFQASGEDSSSFSKGELLVVPSVSRSYGGEADDRLSYYFELYPGEDSAGKVVLDTRIRHFQKGLLYRDTLHVWLGDRPERQLREISLGDLTPGEYELEVAVKGRRMKELSKRTAEFRVTWTEEAMIRHDWKSTLQQLDLLTEENDVGAMEKLETFEERLTAFNQYWRERDPTAGTPENELKIAFYFRVRVADENFSIMRRPGWKTDRGRIYVRYGPPDHLVDVPFAPDNLPYQVWHYTSLGRYRRFLFIDENDDGDYRLQYPYDGLNQRPDF